MQFLKRVLVLFSIVAVVSALAPIGAFADAPDPCTSDISGQSKAQLQADLDACNAEIAQWTSILNNTKQQSASYQRDITALTAKINAAKTAIKAKNIAISNLSSQIAVKEQVITNLNDKLSEGQQSLAEILRKTNDLDRFSVVETVLSDKDLSDFFVDVDQYTSTEKSMQVLFDQIQGTKSATEAVKDQLGEQKAAAEAAKQAIAEAQAQVESDQKQKEQLLADSQSKEKTYAQVLADRQAKAAQIKAALFPLLDSDTQIQFGTALAYAQAAERQTGVDAALILAILQQESNLGANVGSCVIIDLTSGETKSVNSGSIFTNGIHPTRDLPILQQLLSTLGRDPLSTRVSCPVSHTFGYGGAMGPSQFIPSTWQTMSSAIARATGSSTPDPWNPKDAIMATALFLRDVMGTTGDKLTDERTAACRYYSGQACYPGGRAGSGLAYGNQVMARVSSIQQNIDLLNT